MDEAGNLNHTKWECNYHVVFIPKWRRKVLYRVLRRCLGEVFRALAVQKESRIEEGHLMPDHVHVMIAIPPKYAVTYRWPDRFGAALATSLSRFERLTFLKAPGSAGGWLLAVPKREDRLGRHCHR